ncbi:ADP-ribosylglycohydrolase family protein [Variovorax sp. J22G21]|uniref:ADP-ribosylglycohydrolase family protein n=1 Tax=Variovorax fucosicus TaxID=3053517 RepID=UPI0025769741|nr:MULTISPECIES: ADP-ribosylglycohydrolase family protein [unclassified Variovorax]MDM0038784.1 ADP-ribosylglycohydrolase family protein [Variovorax sp. J22R193]MDM0063560.1 ADP-ribosylglycohydrolase family protein [Variovorax sp. J22G21]
MSDSRKLRTISSCLWAAYGDALGFPTELANPSLIAQRIGEPTSRQLVPWKRMVGGRFGALAKLDAGSYSDDTQLRLAVSRAIRGDGVFDVEAFAKVELPIWLTYSLGAGRGSKAAASSLANRGTNWFSNFFNNGDITYVTGGGNGAAMRVQPHVWCAGELANEKSFLPDVVRNAVCTHGHVRGIAGAMIHASTLAYVLRTGVIPEPSDWMDFAQVVQGLPEIIAGDPDLNTFWRPTWEKYSGSSLESIVLDVADEWAHSVGFAISLIEGGREDAYRSIVQSLDGFSDAQRGSGLKASLFSLAAAWLLKDLGPQKALEVVANLLHSDTDTIATMAGALLGARFDQAPPNERVQDHDYLEREAMRLFSISQGQGGVSFTYPDLLYWQPPRTSLDSVGRFGESLAIAGLGALENFGEEFTSNQKGTVWQWGRLSFGQTVLCKRRVLLKELPPHSLPDRRRPLPQTSPKNALARSHMPPQVATPDMFNQAPGRDFTEKNEPARKKSVDLPSLDELSDLAIRAQFDPALIGTHLLGFAEQPNGLELAMGYAAIVVKARRARLKRS